MTKKISKFLPADDWQRPTKVTLTDGLLTAFGHISVSQARPEVQLDAVYGLRSKTDTEVITATGGTATVVNSGIGRDFACTRNPTWNQR